MIRLAIGIPTRNRAALAMAAVESVLGAETPEVALVVSDNSTDADEQRRLEEFCAGRGVGYVRPPEPLGMCSHWEWLLRRIEESGEASHVAYLTDRLVFAAGALPELLRIVGRHPEQVVSYHFDSVMDAGAPVELVQSQWTGRLIELDSRKLLGLSSRGEFGDYLPRLMNAIVPAGLPAAIRQRFGDVFGTVSPDYRFAYRCLTLRDTILYLDRPCVIEHGMSRSAGINFLRGSMNDDARRFAGDLTVERFGATPEPAFETAANAIFQEYCAVRAEVGGDGLPPPDARGYLATNAISVDRIEDERWRSRMRQLLERHGWTRVDAARETARRAAGMAAYLLRHPGALARSVKRQLWQRPPGSPAANMLARAGVAPPTRGELKFTSSAEAIAYAGARPRPPLPHAWHVHRLARAGAIVRAQRDAVTAG